MEDGYKMTRQYAISMISSINTQLDSTISTKNLIIKPELAGLQIASDTLILKWPCYISWDFNFKESRESMTDISISENKKVSFSFIGPQYQIQIILNMEGW
jgi:hypothetical protein